MKKRSIDFIEKNKKTYVKKNSYGYKKKGELMSIIKSVNLGLSESEVKTIEALKNNADVSKERSELKDQNLELRSINKEIRDLKNSITQFNIDLFKITPEMVAETKEKIAVLANKADQVKSKIYELKREIATKQKIQIPKELQLKIDLIAINVFKNISTNNLLIEYQGDLYSLATLGTTLNISKREFINMLLISNAEIKNGVLIIE